MNKLVVAITIALTCSANVFAQDMGVEWQWKLSHRCSNTSPSLKVTGVPAGTANLAFKMNDLDFQNKDHGGGSIAHSGGAEAEVAEGALKSGYLGPCPNNFSSFGHDYSISVKALGADGAVLGQASNKKTFSAQTAK